MTYWGMSSLKEQSLPSCECPPYQKVLLFGKGILVQSMIYQNLERAASCLNEAVSVKSDRGKNVKGAV